VGAVVETLPRIEQKEMVRVALKAFNNIANEWRLTSVEAAALADMPENHWKQARRADYIGTLTKDQMLRLSAIIGIYKALKLYFEPPIDTAWIKMTNEGPLFRGKSPVDALIENGLPHFLLVRNYLDALRTGA